MKNLHRDRYQKDMSEDRRGDREQKSYIGISPKRERGREEKSKSRGLSNRSLKTDGETEWRTFTGTDIRKMSPKTDGETESGGPTYGSLKREREREREGMRGKEEEQRSE